jgi:galactokinase/mevalonate kinase-like predicted kinase
VPQARRIVCSAPARANLIGNPSDQYGGSTLGVSLPPRAWAALDANAPGRIQGAPAIVHAVLDAFAIARPDFGVRLATSIPRQSGVAGSTALVVALVRAVLAWQGRTLDRDAHAEFARAVERERMGVQCGYSDPYLCTFGGLRHLDLRGKRFDRGVRHGAGSSGFDREAGPYATVEDLGAEVRELPFVVAYTGVQHSSDAVHRPIRERWLAGEPAVVAAYERIAELGTLGKSALQRGAWPALGALMNENHALQRELGGSGPANERLIAAALAAGAPGAKLAGAGGGGTIVALWPASDAAPLEAALRGAGAAVLWRPVLAPGVQLEPEDAMLPVHHGGAP